MKSELLFVSVTILQSELWHYVFQFEIFVASRARGFGLQER